MALSRWASQVKTKWVDYPYPFNHSRECMLGVEVSEGEVVVFLNNDVVLKTPTALEEMGLWALRPGIATVGCRLIAPRGRLTCAGMRIRTGDWGFWVEESDEAEGAEMVRETVGNTLACAAVSRKTLERLGPLDDKRFPNGYNDVEFCLRATRAGYRHMYLGTVVAEHRPATSRGRVDERSQRDLLRRLYPEAADGALPHPPVGRWTRLKAWVRGPRIPEDLR